MGLNVHESREEGLQHVVSDFILLVYDKYDIK